MLDWIHDFLVRYPELTLFLVISAGYWIGGFKVAGFGLGPVTGSLFAGIAVGQFAETPVSGTLKSFLFLLFLFGIGYSVGPQFLQSLKRDGFKPVLLALVCSVTGLLVAVAVARYLKLDPGFSAGLLSGSLTESPAMGTATEAINQLQLSDADKARYVAHMAVADAVCYVFGAAGLILFCSVAAPTLLRIDLREEAIALEKKLGISRLTPGVVSAWRKFELRAFPLPAGSPLVGRPIRDAEAGARDRRLFVQRLRRGERILEAEPSLVLEAGDILALSGRRDIVVETVGPLADEVEDQELLDLPISAVDVLVQSRDFAGRSIESVAQEDWTRSVYLRSMTRGEAEMPIAPGVVVEKGDILRLVGPEEAVRQAAKRIGAVVAPTTATDFVVLGLAIFLGGLAGVLIAFPIGGVKIALSTSVGTLLAGLAVGHLRTRYPLFGRIPDGAVSLMTALGLAAFVGMTGLHAGPVFFKAIAEAGVGLLFGGMIVTLVPPLVGLFFGRYVLGMNPILVLGAIAGAQTMTAAMAAVQERSGSPVAVLGYTPAVPVGHILLTTWGSVIVSLTAT
ncbi:putative transporter [Alsobacter metallidurans]|uniref:Transporter n=1 Tax=Alsobacter metallidurans TaxID=340221 RepID=A0A917I4S6_9HYPH|nr:aspartate-alanine antiporter [Alsobacter metallidurans]GGH11198.1 putative transporter [Alsobacter metallidurans]